MREFNLEEAGKGKPVCTRNKNSVRILCFNAKDMYSCPIVGLINEGGVEHVQQWRLNGAVYRGGKYKDDLFMTPEKKKGWIAILHKINHSSNDRRFTIGPYDTEETLDKVCNEDFEDFKVLLKQKVSWEE